MEEQVAAAGNILDKLIDIGVADGPKLIGAIIVLVLGFWVANAIAKATGRMLEKRKIDVSVIPFFKSLTGVLL